MNSSTARPQFRFVALLIICLLPSIASAQIPQFDCMYVFGDSLADNGNTLIHSAAMGIDPPVPPSATPHRTYFEGRFSNGYVGVEFLWEHISGHLPGSVLGLKPSLEPSSQNGCAINFAFGGTGTPYIDQTPGGFPSPGLKGQVKLFRSALGGERPSTRALYVVSTGSNDYRDDPFNVPMKQSDVVRNIEDAIVSLYKLGARNVMVVDLPDFGRIPAYAGDPKAASKVSRKHNTLLKGMLARLQAHYPKLHLIPVKLDPLFDELVVGFGATALVPMIAAFEQNPACLFINPVLCTDMPDITFQSTLPFLFWDVVHPTTAAHRYLGAYMYKQLASEYK